MKKCTHCGYKNSDADEACNLCRNRLPKETIVERKPGADNEPFHEPRKWAGSASGAPPMRIERGTRNFDLGGGVTSSSGGTPAPAPAPAPAARPDVNIERHYLVPPTGEIVRLEVGKIATIGRDAGCTVKVASGKVSRRHCEIRWEGTPPRPFVHDLGSQNGTYVDERKLETRGKHELKDGEEIEIGDVKQRYRSLAPGISEATLREMSAATIVATEEPADDAGLTGNAALLPIGEVLQRLESLRAWGKLEVEVGTNRGEIVLENGRPVSGTYAGLDGTAAVTAVATLKQGRFRFEQAVSPEPATIEGPGGRAIPAPPRDSTAAGPKGPPPAPRPPVPAPKQPPRKPS